MPCHGRADQLAAILPPLLADPGTLEVVVVADRDERVAIAVEALAHPAARVVRADAGNENGARQVGVAAARAEVVVVLDDDVLALPGLVSQHLTHDHRGRVVLGYMPVEPARLLGVRRFPARMYQHSYAAQVAHWERHPESILEKFWAGNFSARRDELLELGIENPRFRGKYFPDYELGLRLHAAGFVGSFDRAAAAWHLYERDAEGFVRDSRRQGAVLGLQDPAAAPPTGRDRLAANALLVGTYAAAALRARRAERLLARRLRSIEQRAGAHAAQSGEAERLGLLLPRAESAERSEVSDG